MANLPDYFPTELAAGVRHIELAKGEHLFRVSQKVNGIYFLLQGEMKAVRPMLRDNEAVMMRAREGEFFAESAIATSSYTCDGICVEDAMIAFISSTELEKALLNPEFSKAFFLANAANTRRQCSRYERIRLRRAKDRVLHLLTCETGPDGIFNWFAPLSELANELALEPETLYRVLSELENDGLIVRAKKQIRLNS